jgi:oligopeptide/dipeptide ABC transporter ATP-binding protein
VSADIAGRPAVLSVRGLRVATAGDRRTPGIALVEGVELDIAAGELVCVVGESGSGKTVTGQAILGMAGDSGLHVGGSIRFDGAELVGTPARHTRSLRGRELALVPQEPSSALDPLFTIGAQVAESVRRREGRVSDMDARVVELLRRAHVPQAERRRSQYPHELSGGLCQRVLVAMALAGRPDLIVADEPTSALDATVQVQILDLLDEVRVESGTAILLITHDIGVAARADRIVVMYAGTVVEQGPAAEVLAAPRHPYTAGLIAAVPRLGHLIADPDPSTRLAAMPGGVPSPSERPSGCVFRSRCVLAVEACAEPQHLLPAAGAPESASACWRTRDAVIDPDELWSVHRAG